jgi:hypothetical protein
VDSGAPHFFKMMEWMVLESLSKIPVISVLLALLCALGAWQAFKWRQARRFSLFLVMVLYICFFSRFRVMIVRNLLFVIPWSAVLAACGFQGLLEGIRNRAANRFMTATLFLIVSLSAASVARASLSVLRHGDINLVTQLQEYLGKNRQRSFAFSPMVRQTVNIPMSPNPQGERYLVFFRNEIQGHHFEANEFRLYEVVAGPQDANLTDLGFQ